jgi:hypothetical protein
MKNDFRGSSIDERLGDIGIGLQHQMVGPVNIE